MSHQNTLVERLERTADLTAWVALDALLREASATLRTLEQERDEGFAALERCLLSAKGKCKDCGGDGHLGKAPDGRLIACEACGGHEDSLGDGAERTPTSQASAPDLRAIVENTR